MTKPLEEGRAVSGVGEHFLAGSLATYLSFSNPSSTNVVQKPLGLALVAFLITVIFILIS